MTCVDDERLTLEVCAALIARPFADLALGTEAAHLCSLRPLISAALVRSFWSDCTSYHPNLVELLLTRLVHPTSLNLSEHWDAGTMYVKSLLKLEITVGLGSTFRRAHCLLPAAKHDC